MNAAPGPAPLRPTVADELGLRHDIRPQLAQRLADDVAFADIAHLALIAVVGSMSLGHAPLRNVVAWVVAVVVAVTGRTWLRRSAIRRQVGPEGIFRAVRIGAAFVGIAWGTGVILVGSELPPAILAWVVVVFTGIVAAATVAMLADPVSYVIIVTTCLGSLLITLVRDVHSGDVFYGALVVVGGVTMGVFYRRLRKALLLDYRRAADLVVSEHSARTQHAMVDTLIENAPGAIALLRDDGTVARVNRAFESLFGYTSTAAVDHRLVDLIAFPEDMAAVLELHERARNGERIAQEGRRRHQDGSEIRVRVAAAAVPAGDSRVTFMLYDDVTEARRAHEAEQSLAAIVESTTDYVSTALPTGPIEYINPAGRRMLGIDAALDVTRLTFMDLVPRSTLPKVMGEQMQALLRDGTWQGDMALSYNGREVEVSAVAMTHKGQGGKVNRLALVARDITDQVAMRAALQAARTAAEQANAAKSSLLANTSHEIRTPLNGILGMTELLLDTDLTADQRRSAELIASSGETLLSTLNDLLDLAKMEAAQLELEDIAFDLQHVLDSAVRLFMPRAAMQGIELVCDIGAGVPTQVRGDPHRLRQVVSNLIGNAIKFTKKGEVVVSARLEATGAAAATIVISVRDSGIGIAPENVERIFMPFGQVDASTTRQFGGTGLGLSIARNLVQLMGGKLAVKSTLGTGSDFHFTIKLPVEAGPAVPKPLDARLTRLGVLVVDDNATNRRVIGDMLRVAGCVVDDAVDAAGGLAAIAAATLAGAPYKLVVSDVQMPVRDGFQLTEDIRANAAIRATKVMLLTSAGQKGDAQRCRVLGVAAYLQKPVSRVELIEAVLAAIHTHTGNTPRSTLVTRTSIDEARRKLRVLIAEDNPVNQEVAMAMLRKRGHTVEVVSDGRAAVESIRGGAQFDVILMDLAMPELSGLQATKEIRALGCATPIVALTANVSPGERDRCLSGGMTGYLSKPFKAHELFAVVEGWGTGGLVANTDNTAAVVSSPPVNIVAFQAMLAEAGIHNGDEMLRTFLTYSSERIPLLQAAAERGDMDVVEQVAHMLKSGSGTVRADGLAELFRQAEAAAQASDVIGVRRLAVDIEGEYLRAADCVHAHLEPKAA